MSAKPRTPAQAQQLLAEQGPGWWRAADVAALEAACASVPDAVLPAWPDVARWRALAALLRERDDALSCLELAYAGHLERGDARAAGIDAHIALVQCLVDPGAMGSVIDWVQRARAAPFAVSQDVDDALPVWLHAGTVAHAVLADDAPDAIASAQWLHAQLQPMRADLSANERIIGAQVLVNFHLARGSFEKFDLVATAIGEPVLFERASAVVRARWLHTLGFAHYQIGNAERAEGAWQRALDIARTHDFIQIQLLTSVAMLRLLLDRGRLDDAELIEKSIRPEWGAGRDTQLIDLKQMSARLQMLRGQPARALATLQEALALADDARLSEPERASCLTDLVQLLIANKRDVESVELLEKLTSKHGGRDGEVFRCLLELLQAWRGHVQDEDACRGRLSAGLGRAQRVRYTMFFRLLPRLAAELCALALRWQIEPTFVVEIIRTRDLRAPDAADERWPWTVYVRMLGGFDLRVRGEFDPHKAGRKVPKKPLELLRAIACENEMAISVAAAADALWPDAEGDQARKNLETTVQRLRRLLGDHDNSLVLVGDGQVALDPRRVTSDVVQRRALIKRLETMASRPEAAGEYAAVALRIAELSRGGLLPGVPDSPWLETERRRCERDALRAQRAAPTTTENAFPGELDRPK